MPIQPESAIEMLDLALGRVDMVRTCLDELRRPDVALVPAHVLITRAESCMDDVLTALHRLRVRIADLEAGR